MEPTRDEVTARLAKLLGWHGHALDERRFWTPTKQGCPDCGTGEDADAPWRGVPDFCGVGEHAPARKNA
jgi:hypothetical protein